MTRRPAKPTPSRAVGAAGATLRASPLWVTQPTALTAHSPVGLWVITGCQALTAPTVHPLSQCLLWAYRAPDPGDQRGRGGPGGPEEQSDLAGRAHVAGLGEGAGSLGFPRGNS